MDLGYVRGTSVGRNPNACDIPAALSLAWGGWWLAPLAVWAV